MLLLAVVSPQLLSARVGETQADVERRILQPNLGKLYFRAKDKDKDKEKEKDKDKDKDSRDAERERLKDERELPFYDAEKFFPSDARAAVYWKSAVANQLSNDNGWMMHVFYVGGRSALEAYRRVGDSLNEFEVRALLAANRGTSSWRKMSNDGGGTSGIGYDYELEDGSMRAKQQGDWLMIFSTRFDIYVVAQQKVAKDLKDKEADRLRKEQQAKTPESVSGF